MAAYAALVSLLNNMEQIKNHPTLYTYFHKKQFESLREKIYILLEFIETYNSHGGSKEAQDLEAQIASAAHEAEDVIESHIVDHIHAESYEAEELESQITYEDEDAIESHVVDQTEIVQLHHRWLLDLQKEILDMDSLTNKVLKFKEKEFNDQKASNSMLVSSSTPLTAGKSSMVRFEDEVMQLLDVLIGQQSSRQIISIVGMGGTGKTTLAKHIYEHSLIMHHFDLLAWATISQVYDVRDIILQLLPFKEKVTNESFYDLGEKVTDESFYDLGEKVTDKSFYDLGKKVTDESLYDLGEQLYRSLSGRRYLLILDDMWNIEVWDMIKFFFADNSNGSRVILTTRLSNMAAQLCSFCIRINFLGEHTSWKLFCQHVFEQEVCPPELVGIGKEIVEKCKGLPLSIVVIGGLLRKSYRTKRYWHSVAKNISSILNSRENGQCLDVLYLSYSHLPAHLKPCFLYMGTFKEGCEIRASEINKLWVAEGFLKPSGEQTLEEIAEDYLKALIDRNLILVSGHRLNGKIKSFRIHDLLRELCLKVANKEKFFCVVRVPSTPRGIDRERRLIYHHDSTMEVVQDELHNLNLRYFSYLPYGVRDWFKIPCTISLTWNLQTLIIGKGNQVVVVAPLEIWKIRQLRHLKCSQIMLPDPSPGDKDDDSVVLGNLQTLGVVVNFRWSEEACRRIPNVKKLQIAYDDIWEGYNNSLLCNLQDLGRLHKLVSLNIRCSWTTPVSINELKNAFSYSLNKLSLTGCTLRWEDISKIIGSLPHLKVLKLKDTFCEILKWNCVEGGFLRLKFLQIESCDLKSWIVDNASYFPVLEKLFLNDLWNLNEIPPAIGEIPTLQLIRLEHCTDSLTISAMRIKEEQENFGNDDIQIQVLGQWDQIEGEGENRRVVIK